MKVLVDTSVWSEFLRYKNPNQALTNIVKDLIQDSRVVLIGPIRQELLSGISDPHVFHQLKETLSAYDDMLLLKSHFEKAAEFSNFCRKKGVQGSVIDFLICAVANLENLMILTTDKDFEIYKKHLAINLMN